MELNEISKFISLILRHKPEVIGIQLDLHGWAKTDELITGICEIYPSFSMTQLETIVNTDNKQRYSFSEDKSKIRANQGHSINIDLELVPVNPPTVLYHGTAEKYVASIEAEGLISKSRQYVHLSADIETAVTVGSRHGSLVIYEVAAEDMNKYGYEFYSSENKVWLTRKVPAQYLKIVR